MTAPQPVIMRCRCGNALRFADMRRIMPSRATAKGSSVVWRIGCPACARKAAA